MKKQKKNISLTLIGNTDKLLRGFSGKGGKRYVKSGVWHDEYKSTTN